VKNKTAKSEKQIELSNDCDFRDVGPGEIDACCYYEYLRESAVMRRTCVLPTCEDQTARSSLQLVLAQHDWQAAANNNEAPPPWKTLTAHTKAK